ncbi:hypothetical protein [Erwinia piriflorinigrans]|uniref:Fimbrial protein n=1 Tax=Erwinia piriflorinigrans CFBP 5888 TaxID=1161919 RepID=V5Z8R8_9GAMM|nr:hypothetical protein [Erwinia piriflorinigrans]CCG87340.1 hypothetical protein EPIR_1975 [Erwinia piriflorinigrans CFBP 5888]
MRVFYRTWILPLLMAISHPSTAEPNHGIDNLFTPQRMPDAHCTISVSNPFVDYGVMSRWQMQDLPNRQVTPGIRSTMVNVVCPHSRPIKLLVQGEVNETGHLRYGDRGYTRFRLLDVELDGNAAELRPLSPDGALAEAASEALALASGQRLIAVSSGRVIEGKMLTARLEIQPTLGEENARVSSMHRSESQLTLTLID